MVPSHTCVEHCHNRWRTETKNRIVLHVKEVSHLQKHKLVISEALKPTAP